MYGNTPPRAPRRRLASVTPQGKSVAKQKILYCSMQECKTYPGVSPGGGTPPPPIWPYMAITMYAHISQYIAICWYLIWLYMAVHVFGVSGHVF